MTDTKYGVVTSNRFNKQLKKIIKQGKDLKKLSDVVKRIANGESLDSKYRDHALLDTKYYRNCRRCHIEPDWLLIYKVKEDEIILYLVETGSHSDLFNM
ncbi:MAG: type II toxin-antitoxin system YafQ family toxin [Bacilli bacterium]|nr:type II toxin-antitoxin system YafQ family toxin [Bacilli bacterium]